MKYYIYKIVNDKNEVVFLNYTKSILTDEFNKINKLFKKYQSDKSLPYQTKLQFKQIAIKNLFNHFVKDGVNNFQILEVEIVNSDRETYKEQKQELNSIINKMNIEILKYEEKEEPKTFMDLNIVPRNNKWL
jgi:hypothetical protein